MAKFKLKGKISTTNMHLFDTEGCIKKFDTPEQIISFFYSVRLDFYEKRKAMLLANLQRERLKLSNKARFVEEVCTGVLVVSNRKRVDLLADLQDHGFDVFQNAKTNPVNEDDDEEEQVDNGKGYDYLLGMKIWTLTFEKVEALKAQLAERTAELDILEATEPTQLWLNDLDAVEAALDERDVELSALAADEQKALQKNRKIQAKANKNKAKGKGKAKKAMWEDESSSEESDQDSDSSMEVEVVKPKPRNKPAATKKAPPAKKTAAPAKKAVAAKPPPPAQDSDDEMDELDLGARLQKIEVTPSKLKAANQQKKRPSPKHDESEADESEEDDFLDEAEIVVAALTPAKKKTVKVTQPVKRGRNKPAAKSKGVAKAPPKKKQVDSDDEDLEFHSDGSSPVKKPIDRPARLGRGASKSYSFDDSEDSDSEFE
jgi:DNA topoisomerase-2